MKHPAPFPPKILTALRLATAELPDDAAIFDPFCGVGGIAAIRPTFRCYGCEIEREWAEEAQRRGVSCLWIDVTAALLVPPGDGFDAVVTSPCYGNRMADNYAPAPTAEHRMRRSYRLALGHALTEGSAGGMQWGDAYRALHAVAWHRCVEALRPGGLFVLDCKNHPRGGVEQLVTEWHVRVLLESGLALVSATKIPLTGDQNTASMRKRGVRVIDHEWVIVLRKPEAK